MFSAPRKKRFQWRFVYGLVIMAALLLAAACGGPAGSGGSPSAAAPAAMDDAELAAQLFELLQNEDVDGLGHLLAEEFIIQRADGTHMNKAEYLANPPTVESFAVSDVVGRQGTENVRAIRYTVQSSEIIDGQYITKDPVPRLSVFVWNGARWQLFTHANFAPIT